MNAMSPITAAPDIGALLEAMRPEGVDVIGVKWFAPTKTRADGFHAVTLHYRTDDGLGTCENEHAPTVEAAFALANLKRLTRIAADRKSRDVAAAEYASWGVM